MQTRLLRILCDCHYTSLLSQYYFAGNAEANQYNVIIDSIEPTYNKHALNVIIAIQSRQDIFHLSNLNFHTTYSTTYNPNNCLSPLGYLEIMFVHNCISTCITLCRPVYKGKNYYTYMWVL